MDNENPVSNEMPRMTGEKPPRTLHPKRPWWKFFRDILLYLITYIGISGLTIGPFFWSWFGSVYVDGPKWIARIYLPLLFFCEIFPPLGWLINTWINWWIL